MKILSLLVSALVLPQMLLVSAVGQVETLPPPEGEAKLPPVPLVRNFRMDGTEFQLKTYPNGKYELQVGNRVFRRQKNEELRVTYKGYVTIHIYGSGSGVDIFKAPPIEEIAQIIYYPPSTPADLINSSLYPNQKQCIGKTIYYQLAEDLGWPPYPTSLPRPDVYNLTYQVKDKSGTTQVWGSGAKLCDPAAGYFQIVSTLKSVPAEEK